MALPPPVVQSGSRHGAAEALEPQVKEAPRESGTRLTVGRRTAPQTRPMGQMTAGRVTVQPLPPAELHGGDWREHTVAPGGIPDLTAYRQEGCGWQPHGPLAR